MSVISLIFVASQEHIGLNTSPSTDIGRNIEKAVLMSTLFSVANVDKWKDMPVDCKLCIPKIIAHSKNNPRLFDLTNENFHLVGLELIQLAGNMLTNSNGQIKSVTASIIHMLCHSILSAK